MKLISHRGNITGPIDDKENRPSYIDCAIQLGYEVEVDLRYINGQFWLGHDYPQYKIEKTWMDIRKDKIWYHCKDKESALELIRLDFGIKFFCHSQDDFVLTNTNHLWVHNLNGLLNTSCIIPLLGIDDIDHYSGSEVYGVCTDYITYAKKTIK